MSLTPEQDHTHSWLWGDGPKISFKDLDWLPQIWIATLVAWTVTVLNGYIDTNSVVLLSVNGIAWTPGYIYEDTPSRLFGTSFTIKSTSWTDTSTIWWQILNL